MKGNDFFDLYLKKLKKSDSKEVQDELLLAAIEASILSDAPLLFSNDYSHCVAAFSPEKLRIERGLPKKRKEPFSLFNLVFKLEK